jgi:hypothetical protein
MTSLAFILGVLPLAIATGAGANARHSIGTGIMGGMIGEATLAMIYVPLFFYIFDEWAERSKKKAEKKQEESPPGKTVPVTEGGHCDVWQPVVFAKCFFARKGTQTGCPHPSLSRKAGEGKEEADIGCSSDRKTPSPIPMGEGWAEGDFILCRRT